MARELEVKVVVESSAGKRELAEVDKAVDKIGHTAASSSQRLQDAFAGVKLETAATQIRNFDRELNLTTERATKSWTAMVNSFDAKKAAAPFAALVSAVGGTEAAMILLAAGAGAAGAALGALGLVALGLASAAARVGAALRDASLRLDVSVEDVSRLSNAATVAGTNLDQLSGVINTIQKRMADHPDAFANGLAKIGLQFETFKFLAPDKQLLAIAEGLKAQVDPLQKNAAGYALMGSQFKEIEPALDKLNKAMALTKDLNPWTDAEARQAEEFQMAVAALRLEFDQLAVSAGREVLPFMLWLVENLPKIVSGWADLAKHAGELILPLYQMRTGWQIVNSEIAYAIVLLDLFRGKQASLPAINGQIPGTPLSPSDAKSNAFDLAHSPDALVAKWTAAAKNTGFVLPLADEKSAVRELAETYKALDDARKKAAAIAAEHARNLEEYAHSTKSYAEVLDLIGNELYEGIAADKARGVSTKALVDIYKTSATLIEDVVAAEKTYDDGLDATLKQMAENEKETAKFQEGFGKLTVTMTEAGKAAFDFRGILHTIDPALIQNTESLVQMQRRLKDTEDAFRKAYGAFAELSLGLVAGLSPSGAVPDALNNTDHMAHRLELDLNAISTAFERIGVSSQSGLGQAVGQFLQLFRVIERANNELSQVQTKYGVNSDQAALATTARNRAVYGAAVGIGASLVAQNINTGAGASTGNLVAAGALQGAAVGAGIGAPYAASTFGISVGVGAAAGGIAGWIQSGKEWRKVVNDIGRDMGGLHVSEDFAKMIDDLESQTGLQRVQAITTQLDKLIEQAGGLKSDNFDLFFGKLHDAFSYIEQGTLSVAQVTQIMDKNFASFAAAGTDAYGRISDKIRELIDLDQRFGTDSKAIADWMRGQAAAIGSGLADLLSQPMIAASETVRQGVDTAQKALDDLRDSGTASVDALTKAQDNLTHALTIQHQEAERNKQALDDMGLSALLAFNAAIASGQTFAQALAGIAGPLSTLEQAYKNLGLTADDPAVRGLLLQNQILNGPGGTGKAIGGLEALITAAGNVPGLMTPDAFAAQQRSLGNVYTQTQAAAAAAGGTTANALAPFQQTLHLLQDWATKNHIELDENTQRMIDQSKELGLWTDDFKTDSEKTRQSIADLIASNDRLIAALGGASMGGGPRSGVLAGDNFLAGDDPTGGLWHPPNIVEFASEAYVRRPTLAMVGDGGPEFVLKPSTVSGWMASAYGRGAAAGSLRGSGSAATAAPVFNLNLEVVIQGGGDPEDMADQFTQAVRAKLMPEIDKRWREMMRSEGHEIAVQEFEDGRRVSRMNRALSR